MKRLRIAASLLFAFTPTLLSAGQIGIDDFTAAAVVQDFEGDRGIVSSPIAIGSDAYDADTHRLNFSSKFGETIGRTGVAFSNTEDSSNPTLGFIDVTLGNPALRVGLYVGFQFSWEAKVDFYDTEDDLLGTLAFTGDGGDNEFAAWQTEEGLIKRLRIADTTNNESSIIIDDLIQEVPEPGSLLLLSLGAIGGLGFRQRRCRSPIFSSL